MAYKYEKSESFRANIYLFAGYALTSPFWLYLLGLITRKEILYIDSLILLFLIFTVGVLSIIHSYYIIWKKDENND
jgi:hypothetical protein